MSCFLAPCFCNCCVDCVVNNALLDDADIKAETKATLERIHDSTAIITVLTGPKLFYERVQNPLTDADIKTENIDLGWEKTGSGFDDWKKDHVRKIDHKISDDFHTTILGSDDNFGDYTFMEKLTGKALRNRCILPLEDSAVMLKDDELAERFLNDLLLEQGKALPVTYNTDFNMKTDESFSRIFFYGMGSVLLAKQNEVSESEYGPFVVDMPLQNLMTRKLYRKYGARVHFGEDQMVTAIYDYQWKRLVKPGDTGWDAAKMLAKVSALFLMTAREHLVWTHLIASNIATRETTLKLPPCHPIRRLLTIFTYRSTEVNLEAFDALVPNTSLLHRSAGLTYESMKDLFNTAYTSCDIFEPFADRKYNPALQKLSDDGKFPYISQGSEYYEIVRAFVRDWLDNAGDTASDAHAKAFYKGCKVATVGQKYVLPNYSAEGMVNLISSIIFAVTAYHEMIGHVVDYTILPSRSGFRLSKSDPTEVDLQSLILTALITASTSVTMPQLMNEFNGFFGAGGAPAWEKDVWASFNEKLKVQSMKVQEEDTKRPAGLEFKYFDPARFECSVSV
jgi:hypothetical protein